MSVFDRVKALFAGSIDDVNPDDVPLATAVILLELSMTDNSFEPLEMQAILKLLSRKFGCTMTEARMLVQQAEEKLDGKDHFYKFSKMLKDNLDDRGREGIVEMLWQVVYVDGTLDDYEAAMMRKIAGMLYVSDKRSGEIRKMVQAMYESGTSI